MASNAKRAKMIGKLGRRVLLSLMTTYGEVTLPNPKDPSVMQDIKVNWGLVFTESEDEYIMGMFEYDGKINKFMASTENDAENMLRAVCDVLRR